MSEDTSLSEQPEKIKRDPLVKTACAIGLFLGACLSLIGGATFGWYLGVISFGVIVISIGAVYLWSKRVESKGLRVRKDILRSVE